MKKYAIISNEKRQELIQRVVHDKESVGKVAKKLRMKLPSAKSIIRTYKKTGKIFDKKKTISRKSSIKRQENAEKASSECQHSVKQQNALQQISQVQTHKMSENQNQIQPQIETKKPALTIPQVTFPVMMPGAFNNEAMMREFYFAQTYGYLPLLFNSYANTFRPQPY